MHTPSVTVRRVPVLLTLGVIICSAGCGPSPSSPSRLPVYTGTPLGAPQAFAHVDLATCLGGSGEAACFSAPRVAAASTVTAAVTSSPINLTSSVSGSTVVLSWSAPPIEGSSVLSYVVEAGSASGLSNLADFNTGNAGTSLTAPGVPNGTYYVRVRAVNLAGVSAASNETVAIVGAASCLSALNAPLGLTASVAGASVTLTWGSPIGGCPPTSYVLEAGSAPGLVNLANGNTGSTATTYSASDVGVGTYYVRVRAQNAYGISASSNEVVVIVGPNTATPIDLSGTWIGTNVETNGTVITWRVVLTQNGTQATGTQHSDIRALGPTYFADRTVRASIVAGQVFYQQTGIIDSSPRGYVWCPNGTATLQYNSGPPRTLRGPYTGCGESATVSLTAQ